MFPQRIQPTLLPVGTALGKNRAGAGEKREEEGAAERSC